MVRRMIINNTYTYNSTDTMKKNKIQLFAVLLLVALGIGAVSCDDNESYAEKLDKERKASNAFLSGYNVEMGIPADTVFVTVADVGEANAPFYRIEPEGNVYMQVVRAGDRDSMAHTGDKIYFRYSRYSLLDWYEYGYSIEESNSVDMEYSSRHFYYNDFSKSASVTCGMGLQLPLQYVGINSEVNLVIKSQYGIDTEMTNVAPFRWNVRYFKSAL